jgi:hypothetical protein
MQSSPGRPPFALRASPLAIIVLGLVLALGVLGSGGCRGPARGHNYVVRAELAQPPGSTGPHTLFLHHEAIDDWVSRDGKADGMDSMAMPFPVADNVPISALKADDKVEVILHVDWDADRPVEITGLRMLDPGLRMEFRAARPPAGKPAPSKP